MWNANESYHFADNFHESNLSSFAFTQNSVTVAAFCFVFHHLPLIENEILIQPDLTNSAKNCSAYFKWNAPSTDWSGNENPRFLLTITWLCTCSCGNVNCVANMNKIRDLWTSWMPLLNKNKNFRLYVIDILRVEYNVCAHMLVYLKLVTHNHFNCLCCSNSCAFLPRTVNKTGSVVFLHSQQICSKYNCYEHLYKSSNFSRLVLPHRSNKRVFFYYSFLGELLSASISMSKYTCSTWQPVIQTCTLTIISCFVRLQQTTQINWN